MQFLDSWPVGNGRMATLTSLDPEKRESSICANHDHFIPKIDESIICKPDKCELGMWRLEIEIIEI